jgi:hypothetical protein
MRTCEPISIIDSLDAPVRHNLSERSLKLKTCCGEYDGIDLLERRVLVGSK